MKTILPQDVSPLSIKYGIPIIVRPGFNNAFFVRPSNTPVKMPENTTPMVRDIVKLKNEPTGGIVVGESLLNPTTIAHEVGHSKDTNPISRMAPTVNSIWDTYKVPLLGTIGASIAGMVFPQYRRPLALANLGVQALSMAPTLYSEYKASEIAKELDPSVDKEQLNTMYKSYLSNLTAKRLAIPLAIHTANEVYSQIFGE